MERSMKDNLKLNRKSKATGEAPIQPARLRDRDIKKKWATRIFREGASTGPAFVEYTFPTQDGAIGHLRVPFSELRHPKRLLDQLYNHMPVFPRNLGVGDNSQF